MMAGGASPVPDPFFLHDNWDFAAFPRPNRDANGLAPVNPNLVSGETTCVIIAVGQSTITSNGNGTYTKTNSKIHMLNMYNGGMYSAVNPMLGGDGTGECFLIRLADKMITAGKYQRVILAAGGLGSTDISRWPAGAFCNERLTAVCSRVKSMGLLSATKVYCLWQQGESDTVLATSQAAYTAALTGVGGVIPTIRSVLPTTPIYVSQTSYENGVTSATVRAAQTAAVGGTVFAGPDTDTIPSTSRFDNIHPNATGADQFAGLWNGVLA